MARRLPRTHVELEDEVNRRLAAILQEKKLADELAAIRAGLDRANHLKEEMVTKSEFEDWKKEQRDLLSHMVVVQDLGQGEYAVRLGDVILGPEDVDELPVALRASRSARSAAARAAKRTEDLRRIFHPLRLALATTAGSVLAAVFWVAGSYAANAYLVPLFKHLPHPH